MNYCIKQGAVESSDKTYDMDTCINIHYIHCIQQLTSSIALTSAPDLISDSTTPTILLEAAT